MDIIKTYTNLLFREKPLLGYGLVALILWIAIDFYIAIIPFTVGLYITLRRQDQAKASSGDKKKCPQCQMDIPILAKKCPHCHSKQKVSASALVKTLIFFAVAMMLGGLFSALNSTPAPQDTYVPQVKDTPVTMVFDVPSLVGRSLLELETELGTPTNYTPPTDTYREFSEIRTWEKSWQKDGYSLMVTYNIDTNEVTDLFLGTDTDAALVTFRSTNNILKVGNLQTDSTEYTVEFVKLKAILGQPKSSAPDGYTGAIIRSK